MFRRNESEENGSSVEDVRGVFRALMILAAVFVLAGVFQGRFAPAVKVSIPGAALMILGLIVAVGAGRLVRGLPEERRAGWALAAKLGGVLACGVGAILIICAG